MYGWRKPLTLLIGSIALLILAGCSQNSNQSNEVENQARPPSPAALTIVKNSVGGVGAFSFTLTPAQSSTPYSVTTVGNSSGGTGQTTPINIPANTTHSLVELNSSGWTLQSQTCKGDNATPRKTTDDRTFSPDSFSAKPKEIVVCTFTNKFVPPSPQIELSYDSTVDFVNNGGHGVVDDREDNIHYTITATNTGNVALTNVVISDTSNSGALLTHTCATLAVGSTCVLQHNESAEDLFNLVTITGIGFRTATVTTEEGPTKSSDSPPIIFGGRITAKLVYEGGPDGPVVDFTLFKGSASQSGPLVSNFQLGYSGDIEPSVPLPGGFYHFTNAMVPGTEGWVFDSGLCDDTVKDIYDGNANDAINVGAFEHVTCIFTYQGPPTFTLTLTDNFESPPIMYTVHVGPYPPMRLESGTYTFDNLPLGSLSVLIAPDSRGTVTMSCSKEVRFISHDSLVAELFLTPGSEASCTFTNSRLFN